MSEAQQTAQMPTGRLIDFHTHILPAMDDGSHDIAQSTEMLRSMTAQGVCCVVATPHFYAASDYPVHFLEKRENRFRTLQNEVKLKYPILIPGAEIEYYEGITEMEALPMLHIGTSPALLIEMPFGPWTSRVVDNILELNSRRGIRVVIAHIERYMQYQKDATLYRLIENGVYMQSNASFFLSRSTWKKALSMLDDGMIHLLGSDCHNTTTRSPNLRAACEMIKQKRGPEAVKRIMDRGFRLLLSNTNIGPSRN